MSSDSKALGCAAFAVLSWSTVATSFKFTLRYFSNYEMLLVACFTAIVVFGASIVFQKKSGAVTRVTRRQLGVFAVMGLLNPTAYYLVLFKAYDLLPAQIAQPLNYAWPIVLLVLLAVFAHKPIPKAKYFGMLVSLGGVALISSGGGSVDGSGLSVAGIMLALLSAVLWATYWLANDKMSNGTDPVVALFYNFLFGTAYLCIGLLVVPAHFDSWQGIAGSVYVGLFEIGLPFLAFGAALRLTSNPALINQLCYISPFLSLFIISLMLGERIAPTTYVGLMLIVSGLVYNQFVAREGISA